MQHPYFARHKNFAPYLHPNPDNNLGIVVVLPSYNEPNLNQSLQALAKCHRPSCAVEVLVVVNFPEGAPLEVVENAQHCVEIVRQTNELCNSSTFRFYPIEAFNLPKKHAGVGLARKTGMDEAVWRLLQSESETKIVACFDADATCSSNYLTELEKLWIKHPATTACSIRYEHPIDGNEFSDEIYQGIAEYELHLRYYVQAGKYINHPFSEQTVGSSMACSVDAYMRYGGMNKNKAGEDFYFLQKIIPHGNFRNLNSAVVYPSPRTSYRVPFGTGRAMTKYIETGSSFYQTYSFLSFLDLKDFIHNAPLILFKSTETEAINFMHKQPVPLKEFLEQHHFAKAINEINSNTSTSANFTKRFFLWFDAFKLLKYLNFAHEIFYTKEPVAIAAKQLIDRKGVETNLIDKTSAKELLQIFRKLDADKCNT